MKFLVITLVSSIIFSCQNNTPFECNIDQKIIATNDSIMNSKDFRIGFLTTLEETNESLIEQTNLETYRLFITYTFNRRPWVYKIVKTNSGGNLTIKKNYKDIYKKEHGIKDTVIQIKLNEKQWSEIRSCFYSNCFWTMPITIDDYTLDGRTCILEAFDPKSNNPIERQYFIVGRASPKKDSDFRKICDKIEDFEITQ